MAVRSEIESQLADPPCVTIAKWARLVVGKIDTDLRCAGIEATKRSVFLREEKAAEEWAHREVCGTRQALQIRKECECFGVVLWQAGINVSAADRFFEHKERAFEGLLTNSTVAARTEDHHEAWIDDDGADVEFQCEDEQCISAKAWRHSAHGAPFMREWTAKAWVAGSRLKVKAPVHPRQQKQANVRHARKDVAEARRLRCLMKSRNSSFIELD